MTDSLTTTITNENENENEEELNKSFQKLSGLMREIPEIFEPILIALTIKTREVVLGNKLDTLWREGNVWIPTYSAFLESFSLIPISSWKRISINLTCPSESSWVVKQKDNEKEETFTMTFDNTTIIIDPITWWFFMDSSYYAFKQDQKDKRKIISMISKFDLIRSFESENQCLNLVNQLKEKVKISEVVPRIEEIIEKE